MAGWEDYGLDDPPDGATGTDAPGAAGAPAGTDADGQPALPGEPGDAAGTGGGWIYAGGVADAPGTSANAPYGLGPYRPGPDGSGGPDGPGTGDHGPGDHGPGGPGTGGPGLGGYRDGGFGPPPGPPPVATPKRHRVRNIIATLAVLLLVGFVIGAAVVPLPYYAFKPGSVRDTERLITVGEGAEMYPSEGSISYTTVSLRQATLFSLVTGWIDDDVDIHPEDEVLGDRDADENRTFNLALMDDSKNVAAQVALERLGYEVPVSSNGVHVLDVGAGTGGEGILEVGDVILSVDGEVLDQPEDLARIMDGKAPGETVALEVEALDGSRSDREVTLTPAPDDPERGVMGIVVQARDITYDFPVDVEIDTGDVGGPSAGLAFTLGILDDLTPGELTGGIPVAVTGTIAPDGSVGPVGGTGQKAAAVREAGIDVFLVPSADFDAAEARAGDVEVIAVDTVDEALEALADLGGNGLDLPSAGELAAADESGEPATAD
jgi:PDZ domain-containing protein